MTSTLLEPPETSPLARLCLDHVAEEEAHLRDTLAALHAVREALVNNDQAALQEALRRHEAAAHAGEELRQRRLALQQQAGEALGIPAGSVTVHLIASRLDGESGGLLFAARERLRRQAAEVECLRRSNAALLYYCLDFLQRFFHELTGRRSDGRYGPAGALEESVCGSFIDARG